MAVRRVSGAAVHRGRGGRFDPLVRERGLERFAYFFVTGEGAFFPNGEEEASGYVLNEDGRVFFFWVAWDEARGQPRFSTWEEETPEPDWADADEYREARNAVGLLTAP